MLDDLSSDSDGGVIKKVDAFSDEQSMDSDSEDCIVETDSKVKSTGFFHKLRLRDMLKAKGQKKVEMFREGESEEYNSVVDGDISIEVGINFDILGVRESQSKVHQPLLAFIMHHEELPEDFENLLTFKKHRQNH